MVDKELFMELIDLYREAERVCEDLDMLLAFDLKYRGRASDVKDKIYDILAQKSPIYDREADRETQYFTLVLRDYHMKTLEKFEIMFPDDVGNDLEEEFSKRDRMVLEKTKEYLKHNSDVLSVDDEVTWKNGSKMSIADLIFGKRKGNE